jgi:hypothetical protein
MPYPISAALLALVPVLLSAQGPSGSQGFTPEWDMRPVLKEISAHFGRLLPALDRIDAKAWIAKGAPEMYATQLASVKAQSKAIADEAAVLSRQPEKLSAALQVFFRVQYVETSLLSIDSAIRRYQAPGVADELMRLAAENGTNRERLQKYIVDLAAEREQEFQVADHEAQRCRAFLARQPVASPEKPRRK